jgi:hypothetical protein
VSLHLCEKFCYDLAVGFYAPSSLIKKGDKNASEKNYSDFDIALSVHTGHRNISPDGLDETP